MAVFIVTWNLNLERSNYAQARKDFLGHLARHKNQSDSKLETVRWIETAWTAEQLYRDLAIKIDSNDRLFVAKVSRADYSGYLDQATVDWLAARV